MINYFFADSGLLAKSFYFFAPHVREFDLLDKGYDAVSAMICKTCRSNNWRQFTGEINIHFPGMKGIDIPTVLVFQDMSVCMDCGFAGFTVPEAELRKLDSNDWRNGRDETSGQGFGRLRGLC